MPRNLLFDLGGVIMDIRRDDCLEAFRSLGMEHPENLIGEYVQNDTVRTARIGRDFGRTVPRRPPGAAPRRGHRPADRPRFLRIHHRTPQPRLAALRHLRKRRGVYLLSNTNPIMWRGVIAEEFLKEGLRREDYFDGIVTSFEAKCMKPDERIFRRVEESFGIRPEETLFLDDSQANLEAAARLGYKTMLVAPRNRIRRSARSRRHSLIWQQQRAPEHDKRHSVKADMELTINPRDTDTRPSIVTVGMFDGLHLGHRFSALYARRHCVATRSAPRSADIRPPSA